MDLVGMPQHVTTGTTGDQQMKVKKPPKFQNFFQTFDQVANDAARLSIPKNLPTRQHKDSLPAAQGMALRECLNDVSLQNMTAPDSQEDGYLCEQ